MAEFVSGGWSDMTARRGVQKQSEAERQELVTAHQVTFEEADKTEVDWAKREQQRLEEALRSAEERWAERARVCVTRQIYTTIYAK